MIKRYSVGRTGISAVNLSILLDICHQLAARKPLGYLCLADAERLFRAQRDHTLNELLNSSFLTLTESRTIAKTGRHQGFRNCGHIDAPLFMHSLLLTSAMHDYHHFFYGNDSKKLRQLKDYVKNSYMGLKVAGVQKAGNGTTESEANELVDTLNELKPVFFWCSLPSPEQEQLLAAIQPRLTHTNCIGVGNAFEGLAKAGLTLPDPGKRTIPGKSRFAAIRQSAGFRAYPIAVMIWLLKLRMRLLFSAKKSRKNSKSNRVASSQRKRQ